MRPLEGTDQVDDGVGHERLDEQHVRPVAAVRGARQAERQVRHLERLAERVHDAERTRPRRAVEGEYPTGHL